MSEYIYNAFISYSHRDLSWGKWLQRRLETFRLPRGLSADWPAGKRLKVFRDQTDLAGVGLQGTLRQELAAGHIPAADRGCPGVYPGQTGAGQGG